MNIPELCVQHKKQRLIRRHQLANSKDSRVREIHREFSELQHKRNHTNTWDRRRRPTNEWKESVVMDGCLAEVRMNKIKGQTQTNRAGVGYGPTVRWRTPSGPKREREQMLRIFTEIEEEKRILSAITRKSHFSEWVNWEGALAVDLRWQHVLHKQSDTWLRAVLNSTEDTLPTPSVLKCWRQASAGDGKCPLGCGMAGTLKHILCGCKLTFEQGQHRITWRHDSILLAIYHSVQERIANTTELIEKAKSYANPLATTKFVSYGQLANTPDGNMQEAVAKPSNSFVVPAAVVGDDIFSKATDWKIQFDLDMEEGLSKERHEDGGSYKGKDFRRSLPFPTEIATVSGKGSRPDGVIWSVSSRTVIWIELTSPWEQNMSKRHFEKKAKYNQLAIDLRNPKRAGGAWTVFPFEVEIGARGAINEQPWHYMCNKLGINSKARERLTHAVQDAAVHCSHRIFLCRFHKQWEPQPLLDTYMWYKTSEDSQ